jgi:dihydrofolate synthase / folylpolyglutamate synthase
MDFDQAVAYLLSLGHESLSMKLGLESISKLADILGNPQKEIPAAHIAGTNGKGSTAVMLASIGKAAGLRTGLYTSPHLVDIRERIRVDGVKIESADFARLSSAVREAAEELVRRGELSAACTFFEQVTMIAFLHFREQRVDLGVLEVGLGGRLDATNICNSRVVGITRIAKDHQSYLGDTLPLIAAEKAGIIKPHIPVVSSPQQPSVEDVIRERCDTLEAPLILVDDQSFGSQREGDGFYRVAVRGSTADYSARLSLRGSHQPSNAANAALLAERLSMDGFAIGSDAISRGLAAATWPGRLELFEVEDHEVLLDGAHNPDGAATLRSFLEEEYKDRPITLIFGVMSDKALDEMIEVLFPVADRVIATAIRNPRAIDPNVIREASQHSAVNCAESSEAALSLALSSTPPDGVICVAGSLFLVGEVRAQITLDH